MAFAPDMNKVKDNEENGGGGWKEETCMIGEGPRPCQLVGYVEMGKVVREFKGKEKDPELAVMLIFEFAGDEYTGDEPLTWTTSREFKPGQFFDFIGISDKLYNNELSEAFMNKTSYMKTLTALNDAMEDPVGSLADAVGQMYCMDVVHGDGKEGKVYANMSITGRMNKGKRLNPILDVIERNRRGVIVDDMSVGYPKRAQEDCLIFSWDNPTVEDFCHELLKPWHKKTMRNAVDYHDSALCDLLTENPKLDNSADEDKSVPKDDQSYKKPEPDAKSDPDPIIDDDIPF